MSQQENQSRRVWPCLALALVPFVASCWFNSAPAASPMTGERATAPLVFDQYLVNYGPRPIGPQPLFEVPFYYRNVSDKEVLVKSLTPSCNCLQPRMESMSIPPGGYGRMIMPVKTANEKAGPHEYLVKVHYEADAPGEVNELYEIDLALKVVLPAKQVEVTPRAMWFYQSGTMATTQQIVIKDHRAKSFEITRIECTSDLWTVQQASDLRDGGHRRLLLNVTLNPNVPAGRHRAIINVLTSDPQYPRLQIPVGCEGMQSESSPAVAMVAEPDTIQLVPTPTGELEATTLLRAADGAAAKVESVESSSPDMVTATFETNAENQTIVRVSAQQNDGEKETQRAVITVRTADGSAPLTIPVIIPKR